MAFEPTDDDVQSLATAMLAGYDDVTFAYASTLLKHEPLRVRWHLAARNAFDHPGYLQSMAAARDDALKAGAPPTYRAGSDVTEVMILAGIEMLGLYADAGNRADLVCRIYAAMRLARPLSEGSL